MRTLLFHIRRWFTTTTAYRIKTWSIDPSLEQINCPPCAADKHWPQMLLPYGREAQCPDCGVIWSSDYTERDTRQYMTDIITDDWEIFNEATTHPSTATYRDPIYDHQGNPSYRLNAYCWECNKYTHHSRHDFHTGASHSTCMRCGREDAWQTTVTAPITPKSIEELIYLRPEKIERQSHEINSGL